MRALSYVHNLVRYLVELFISIIMGGSQWGCVALYPVRSDNSYNSSDSCELYTSRLIKAQV